MISEENSNHLNYCFPVGSVFLWPLKKNLFHMLQCEYDVFIWLSLKRFCVYSLKDPMFAVWGVLCLQSEGFCVYSLRVLCLQSEEFCVFSLRGSTTCMRSEGSVYTVWKTLCLQSEGFCGCSLRGSVYTVWKTVFAVWGVLYMQSEGFCVCNLSGFCYLQFVDLQCLSTKDDFKFCNYFPLAHAFPLGF